MKNVSATLLSIIFIILVISCNEKSTKIDEITADADLNKIQIINHLSSPYGITVDELGIYVSNIFANEVLQLSFNGETLQKITGTNIQWPHSVNIIDNVSWVISNYKGKIIKFNPSDKTTTDFLPAVQKITKGTTHVLRLRNKKFVITDFDGSKVVFVNPEGTIDTKTTKLLSRNVKFNKPHMSAEDAEGNIYIADCWNHRIVRIDQFGNFKGWLGTDKNSGSQQGWKSSGEAIASSFIGGFNAPASIHIYKENIYVTEVENHRIQKIDLNGNSMGAIGNLTKNNQCLLRWSNNENIAPSSKIGCFRNPYDLFIFEDIMYVADSKNNRIQIMPLALLDQVAVNTK